MLYRPFSPSGADCAAARVPLTAVSATTTAASLDVVDDFAGLIALSATPRRCHIAKFYTPAGDDASADRAESCCGAASSCVQRWRTRKYPQ
jgi:hypothetical protein